MAILFLIALPFLPLITLIPAYATAPVLVLLGVNMTMLLKDCDFNHTTHALPSYFTMMLMPFFYSIENAILAGIFSHMALVIVDFVSKKFAAIWTGTPISEESARDLDQKEPPKSPSNKSTINSLRGKISDHFGEEMMRQDLALAPMATHMARRKLNRSKSINIHVKPQEQTHHLRHLHHHLSSTF